MKRFLSSAVMAVFLGLTLTGCFVPQKFEAKMVFLDDNTYTYHYKGTVQDVGIMIADANHQKISPALQADSDKDAKALQTHPCTTGFKRNLSARTIDLEQNCRIEWPPVMKQNDLLTGRIFTVACPEKGEYIVGTNNGVDVSDFDRDHAPGAFVDGTLVIVLPHGAKIIKTNADNVNGDTLTWRFTRFTSNSGFQKPNVYLKFKSA